MLFVQANFYDSFGKQILDEMTFTPMYAGEVLFKRRKYSFRKYVGACGKNIGHFG